MMHSDRSHKAQFGSKQGNGEVFYTATAGSGQYGYSPIPTSDAQNVQQGDTGAPPLTMDGISLVPPPAPPKPWSLESECAGLMSMFLQGINVLLVFVPLGIASAYLKWSSAAIFFCNFVAIIPLAAILGSSTEALALHTGQVIGGLLNATFGNAVEMIVTIQAIRTGLIGVVKSSLLGSILSNLLLVLGMAFFARGIYEKESKFNLTGASASSNCLTLGAIALALPTVYMNVPGSTDDHCLEISRISAMVIASTYMCFLVFQLGTHAYLFQAEEEEEEAEISPSTAMLVLLASTIMVAYNSEFLVDSIEGVSEDYGVPQAFIGVILLPIVGNAAEHATSVTVAAKGKMDLALSVAVGSSTQIALLVMPFAVGAGWYYDQPMSLDFRVFDTSVMILSVFLASNCLHDGSSNWLEGVMLVALYVLIAVVCWYMPGDEHGVSHHGGRHQEA